MNNPPTPRFQTCATHADESADWEPDYKDVYDLDTMCQQAVIPLATTGFPGGGIRRPAGQKSALSPRLYFQAETPDRTPFRA